MTMKVPSSLTPALWGAAGGAILLAIVGFSWGGWVTGSTAEAKAEQRASSAVVAALAPICVVQFKSAGDATAKQEELKKISSWDQKSFVEKAGWATMPGSTESNPEVARACADLISKLTL
jgi:pimeloyl-ACP methyl ester carboxylesterase